MVVSAGTAKNMLAWAAFVGALLSLTTVDVTNAKPETPPMVNLARGRRITASSTCGVGANEPELFCQLTGANTDAWEDAGFNLIQGQVCDYCSPNSHPAEFAIDGTERWWQSPPLSRGMSYNEVNLTVDLGQLFHVAFIIVKMGNSPRPGVWVLERSVDNGQTFQPWQYFAETPSDCVYYFGASSLQRIDRDDAYNCDTEFSKIVPLEGGEIVVELLKDRPSKNNFFNSTVLQKWTQASTIRFRFLRAQTLSGHLMSMQRHDPTVTRRYFYSIKDIIIGGRCVCNGHAQQCDTPDPADPYKLLCNCLHYTAGARCERCEDNYVQKAWRQRTADQPFSCEPCNCHGHSEECTYDPEVDANNLSLDIHGNYDGGGVCQNCRDNTKGINCHECADGYFRPYGVPLNSTYVCQRCDCDVFYSTGSCREGSGACECRAEYQEPDCDSCSEGYYDYPNCKPCDCFANGTSGPVCEVGGGQCPCKDNFAGQNCDKCADGYYNFPECTPCECNALGSSSGACDHVTGQCECTNNYGGRKCDECDNGYYGYPDCQFCNCDNFGTTAEICDKETSECICREGFGGARCDQCVPGFYGYPNCQECQCSERGSISTVCDANGQCRCLASFAGRTCDRCSPGYYKYPECVPCNCAPPGSIGISCDDEGRCECRSNFFGLQCDSCGEGFYNYPLCEDCNCDPAGIVASFGGCGTLPVGELCECKERVTGRICNTCKPLYWNLQLYNPLGCEDCNCNTTGVLGGFKECESGSGQCICKPLVTGRTCDRCKDGSYMLSTDNLLGCVDCDCDIGGALGTVCDKTTGMCACQPRVDGRRCDKPLSIHYVPTLHQFQYEIEDGYTPQQSAVRFRYEDALFPNYSWKGYAVFSQLQKEILYDIEVMKSSLYRVIIRYVNRGTNTVMVDVALKPESPLHQEQSYVARLEPSREPTFVTVSGAAGNLPSPYVLNPGRWTVSIKADNDVFVDYFVLLPLDYYEATKLQKQVNSPCTIDHEVGDRCVEFAYPDVTDFASVEAGKASSAELFDDEVVLEKLNSKPMAILSEEQTSLQMDLNVPYAAKYVLVVEYHSPEDAPRVSIPLQVEMNGQTEKTMGRLQLEPCRFNTLCRQAVADEEGRVGHFDLESNTAMLKFENPSGGKVALASVVAIPSERWDKGYILPKKKCLAIDGECIDGRFASIPGSTRIEAEAGNEDKIASVKPEGIQDNSAGLVYLVHDDPILKITGKVPYPGYYTVIVHYHQPQHPDFKVQTVVESAGQTAQGVLPLEHCPSSLGCRAYIRDESSGEKQFQLYDTVNVTLKDPGHKAAWIDYIIAVPMDSFSENFLTEQPVDLASDFLAQCGHNHFYAGEFSPEICKKGIFSLAVDYNNGALPCQCDFQGATSFECDPFGGQCQCRENVIGRKCERCKTGYFGFPNCKACDCPSTSLCDPTTGACICPPRVTGERCGSCEPQTYGFDPIVGCEDCNCNPRGVANLNLQCDLETGQCECKENVVGRTCSSCVAGYWRFPECQLCNCDYRGTLEDICDQDTSGCFCKPNVEGGMCDVCKPGTFNLEEMNPDGCTKCFCFGKTDQCSSASLYWTQLTSSIGWGISAFQFIGGSSQQVPSSSRVQLSVVGEELILSLDGTDSESHSVYFAASEEFIGDRLAAYGGYLSFQIKYEPSGTDSPSKTTTPDLIIRGGNASLIYFSMSIASDGEYVGEKVRLTEMNFRQPSGSPATREQFLLLLHSLEGVYIKATPHTDTPAASLTNFSMDFASDEYFEGDQTATSVEKCACPPSYEGNSCERCAPGHYRAAAGPYGGYCIPCQCNGHTNECDAVTGQCLNCQHNTQGDHCEQCIAGYHGDASGGTPYDCLICACPLPLPSNNFADACQVSPDGLSIKCECKPGYIGPRCEACAAGYYGRPEVAGDYCKPCECNYNINPDDPASCDSVSGECLRCLNNTGGEACALCAPGYFGDAVVLKNCVGCSCEACGTKQCDSYTGGCQCLPNVIGQKCDTCAPNHWGFESCQGCSACDCGPASESTQCEWTTGQCRCKHGVTGRQCDRCEPGFWNYGEKGCERCLCNPEFAFGGGCNPNTGQCECLKGVVGQNCDRCPHRWVLIKNVGCEPCDSCLDGLLDETDLLAETLEPIMADFNEASKGYFTRTRLHNLDTRTRGLQDAVEDFDGSRKDMSPWKNMVDEIESEFADLGAAANDTKTKAHDVELEELDTVAVAGKNEADKAAYRVFEVVGHVSKLAEDQMTGPGPAVDQALELGEEILKRLEETDLKFLNQRLEEEKNNASTLYDQMEIYLSPYTEQAARYEALVGHARILDDKLLDLYNHSSQSIRLAGEATEILNRISGDVRATFDIAALMKSNEETIENAKNNLTSAATGLKDVEDTFDDLEEENTKLGDAVADLTERMESFDNQPQGDISLGARIKARNLNYEVERLESEFANSQVTSSDALRAANAYRDIIAKTSDAENASSNAVNHAQLAKEKSEGVDLRASAAKENSYAELNFVKDNTTKTLSSLADSTAIANNAVLLVENVVNDITKELDDIMRYFDADGNLKKSSVQLTPAAEKAAAAHAIAKGTLDKIDEIYKDIPEKRERAKNALIDFGDGGKVKELIDNRLTNMDKVTPKLRDDVDKLTKRQATLRVYGEDLAQKIKELKENIKLARNKANDIRVGIAFGENTVLQLRPPKNINDAAATTKISLYMNATAAQAKDGFLVYVGHPADTHRQLKNVDSDDFMALELRQGKVTLIADFGSGPNILTNNNKDVVDGQWHRIIAERIGKKLSLKIIDEGPDATEEVDEVSTVAMGTKSVLNWDRDNTAVYVGGFPIDAKIQQAVLFRTFEGGEIEDVTINDVPVSLWNFRHSSGQLEGAIERNKLRKLQQPTGLRFDGEGYAKVNRPEFRYVDRFNIKLDFKTTAQEGIIFLAGNKKKKFTSIELREGRILYQFNLGSIPVQILSEQVLNDGVWHTLEAVRQEGNGKLTIDGVPVPGTNGLGRQKVKFSLPQYLFFGGYQGAHDFPDVSQLGFNGCIDNVEIGDGTAVDLSANVASNGVTPGCPDKTARMVSFDGAVSGYLKMLDKTRPSHMQLTIKFKTIGQNGQLFYSATDDNKEFTSLALRDGRLVMQTQDDKVETDTSLNLNDKNWHYLTATVSDDGLLHLHVDDVAAYSNTDGESTDAADRFDVSRGRDPSGTGVRTFFGGLPETVVVPSGASISDQPFIGCVADATINGEQMNFAESSASHGEQLDKCPILDVAKEDTMTPAVPKFPERFNIAVDRPATQPPTTTPLTTPRSPSVTPSRSEEEEYDYPTGSSEEVTSTARTRLPPPDISNKQCSLPVQPEIDAEVNEDSGYRFGNSKDSRMEFQTGINLKRKSKFSVSFKTTNPEGVLFYVSDKSHTDKIALFMKDGRLHFVFNCGTGPAVIKDTNRTDNGQWHTVEIIREAKKGTLVVDGIVVAEGESMGDTESIDVEAPYYIGGMPEPVAAKAKKALAAQDIGSSVSKGFAGCLKDFTIEGLRMKNPVRAIGVLPCSDKVEPGVFVTAEGGYVIADPKFKVGQKLKLQMEIKPRTNDGILVAVHGSSAKDYLVLQLIDGVLTLVVDNGAGRFNCSLKLDDSMSLCDGNWHNILVVKILNLATLAIDGISGQAGVGKHGVFVTNTEDPLYIGGHPSPLGLPGILTTNQYVGCIRKLSVNGVNMNLSEGDAQGKVYLNSCPTI